MASKKMTFFVVRNYSSCVRFLCLKRKSCFLSPASYNNRFLSADGTHLATDKQRPEPRQSIPEEPGQGPPAFPVRDWVGPADRRSNLRQVCFARPPDETAAERRLRERREEIHQWNQAFWARHNQDFIESKERFVKKALSQKGVGLLDEDGAKRVLSPDEMAEFYCEFLQDNQQTLRQYNRQWYRKNTGLLWPGLKIAVRRLFKR